MNDERVDLSALDPARDRERWERRIREVVACTLLARRWTVSGQLSRWARPALALAAAATLFSCLGLVLSAEPLKGGESTATDEAEQDPSVLLSRWAATGEEPSADSLLTVLGEEMTLNVEPHAPRSIRLLTALLLVGTFALGSVTGAALTLWARSDHRHHGPPPGPPPFGALPLHELDLSSEQRQRADAIFERHRPELDAILQEGFPRVRRVNEQIESEIRAILTPDQRTRLDELKARQPPRHGPGGPFPGPAPDGFGGPPPPPPGPAEHPPWPPEPPAPPVAPPAQKTQ